MTFELVERQLDIAASFANSYARTVVYDQIGWRSGVVLEGEQTVIDFRLGAYDSSADMGFAVDSILDRLSSAGVIAERGEYTDKIDCKACLEGDLKLSDNVLLSTRRPPAGSMLAGNAALLAQFNGPAFAMCHLVVRSDLAPAEILKALDFTPPKFMAREYDVAVRHADSAPNYNRYESDRPRHEVPVFTL